MQLSLSQTTLQKKFLEIINTESRSFYKTRFSSFNICGELDHSFTTTIFNLINKEIASIKDILVVLEQSFTRLQAEKRQQKKNFIATGQSSKFTLVLSSQPFLREYHFNLKIKKQANDYQFLYDKFTASINKLLAFIGVYEELYIIYTLSISFGPAYNLVFESGMFSLYTKANTVSFKVIPLFFLIKYLLSGINSTFQISLILEKLLSNDFSQVKYLVTISDIDQIKIFNKYCNSDYLTKVSKYTSNFNFQFNVPKIINCSQLHV